MVQCESRTKQRAKQGGNSARGAKAARVVRITAETPYGECSERLTAFGGLVALVRCLDLLGCEQVFAQHDVHPKREPKLGGYRMVLGIVMLLFIGLQRLGHCAYGRDDTMVCGMLRVAALPTVRTVWRYLRSLSIVQSAALLRLGAALRARVGTLCEYRPARVTVNIDTTVSTVYGAIEGARKGHNTTHRGKQGLRPVLCFLAETRAYRCGTQRRGETISGREVARQIRQFRTRLPAHGQDVRVQGDGECIGWESVNACLEERFQVTFGNQRGAPPFPEAGGYRDGEPEYNACVYPPGDWDAPCRFVAMRIHTNQMGDRQLTRLEQDGSRVLVPNAPGRPHAVIADDDQRADAEHLIGDAQREGVRAIPSTRLQTHHACFQIVMLAYNLWRWMKRLAGHAEQQAQPGQPVPNPLRLRMPDHTIRMARLKLLYVAAQSCCHGHRDAVLYSLHEQRAAGLMDCLGYRDRRSKAA